VSCKLPPLQMFSFLFGSTGESAADPQVEEGHRGLDVIIDGTVLRVDVDALADASGLFLQVQSTNERECPLEDFPGGVDVFRQIVALLTPAEEAKLHVDEDNVLNLFEAAWLLECPRVFDEVMRSSYMRSLSSRRRVELLEHLLPFTAASNPSEGPCAAEKRAAEEDGGASPFGAAATGEFMRVFLLETNMWQCTEKAALDLAVQLDMGDFVLGPRLATGSLRICCEFLRMHHRRQEAAGLVTSAFQPMTSMWKNLTDRPLRAKVLWDAHLFALQCIRKRLPLDPKEEQVLAGEQEEDEEAKADLPDDVCTALDDRVLLGLAELVQYTDIPRSPPNWAALLIRTLMLSGREEEARRAFVEAFPHSPRLRLLVWREPRVLPAAWLSDVAGHVEASDVLMRVLSGYRDLDAEEFCDIVEHVLLEHFLATPHCSHIVLASRLMKEIVGACFDAGEKVRAPRPPPQVLEEEPEAGAVRSEAGDAINGISAGGNGVGACNGSAPGSSGREPPRRCPAGWDGQHLLWRVAHLGTRLFEAAFVPQFGFLPHRWPDSFGTGVAGAGGTCAVRASPRPEELPVRLEPIVVKVSDTCLWDEGLLQLKLLRPILEVGHLAPDEPALHFGQQVIMRHLWYHHRGSYFEVPRLKELWELARWPLCEDPSLIREALEYLKGTYRELRAPGGAWLPEHEEALFLMFAALDLQRLPVQALLSPWVPAQAQAVRLLVQQQPAEQFHAELQQEVSTASESLKSINAHCQKLHNRLNIVEQRTVINKSQINDAIVVIEEHQRKKSQFAQPPRRTSPTMP